MTNVCRTHEISLTSLGCKKNDIAYQDHELQMSERHENIPSMAVVAEMMINGPFMLKRAESQTPPHIDKLARVFGGTVILLCSVRCRIGSKHAYN
jgi:hypothetical protein